MCVVQFKLFFFIPVFFEIAKCVEIYINLCNILNGLSTIIFKPAGK